MALLPSPLTGELPVPRSRHGSLPAAAGPPADTLPASLPARAGLSQASLATPHSPSVPCPPNPVVLSTLLVTTSSFSGKPAVSVSRPARVIPPQTTSPAFPQGLCSPPFFCPVFLSGLTDPLERYPLKTSTLKCAISS